MGKPSARLTDMTAHGGTIVEPRPYHGDRQAAGRHPFRAGYTILCCVGMDVEKNRGTILVNLGFKGFSDYLSSMKEKAAATGTVLETRKSAPKYLYKILGVPS